MQSQRTLVLIKPEAVERKLIGRIISRFEDLDLNLVAMKMLVASEQLVRKHYTDDKEWVTTVGGKTLGTYQEYGRDPHLEFNTDDAYEIGKQIREWLVNYMTSGPVVALVLEGNHAVELVRKVAGKTIPLFAEPGTIRGDFSSDSPDLANPEKRPVLNLVHASGTVEEARSEIALWFGDL